MLPWIKRQSTSFLISLAVIAVLYFLAAFFVVGAEVVNAQDVVTEDTFGVTQVDEGISLGGTDIRIIIARIIQVALSLVGIVLVGLIIYGGFLIMTSQGNEEKVLQGRKTIINAVIGLAIVLSSLAITQFIVSRLSAAVRGGSGTPGVSGQPVIDTFTGSGALGRVITDHYPLRNQEDVSRNTKIIITFANALNPESLIEDQNQNGVLGDCLTDQENFSWELHCDHLKTESIQISPNETPEQVVSAAAVATYEGENQEMFTIVIRPFDLIGNDLTPQRYVVTVTDQVKRLSDNESIFINQFNNFYQWSFDTGTTADFSPPTVSNIYPNQISAPRNTIVQVTFSEPMDPTTLQGSLTGDAQTSFTQMVFGRTDILGEWRITNGYRTVEFIPRDACGQNSCGEIIRCLPAQCAEDGCEEPVSGLIRTAQTVSENSFESLPFTGVVDVAGNALDGNADGIRDVKPVVPNPLTITNGEEAPDNLLWGFTLKNEIDRSAPYVEVVTPPLDAQNLPSSADVEIRFSQPMMFRSVVGNVSIDEYPANLNELDDLWYLIRNDHGEDNKTVTKVDHRDFGPNGLDLYYFTSVSSSIRSVTQNCLYPGRGPSLAEGDLQVDTSPTCEYTLDSQGNVIENTNCAPVTVNSDSDTACIQTSNPGDQNIVRSSVADCKEFLEQVSIRQ